MCDERTEAENAAYLSRRAVAVGAAAAAMLVRSGAAMAEDPAPPTAKRRAVTITTPDGEADGLLFAPEGKHPGVLMWPDIAGLRPAFETMAARLAAAGYAVLVVNPYYRSAKSPILKHFDEWRTEAGRGKVMPMYGQLSPDAVSRDGAAFVAWLDQQPEVDTAKKVGTQGYCMSGPIALRVGAAVPDRVGVVASFHGGGLVADAPDSPHTLFAKMTAAALICIAQNDHERQPEAKPTLERAAAAAGRTAEITVYPANHGWCAIDSPVFDQAEADKAWARLLAMYSTHL